MMTLSAKTQIQQVILNRGNQRKHFVLPNPRLTGSWGVVGGNKYVKSCGWTERRNSSEYPILVNR